MSISRHASGTYDKATNTGGSNGATMRYALEANDGANAGLDIARNLLEPLKKKYPGKPAHMNQFLVATILWLHIYMLHL